MKYIVILFLYIKSLFHKQKGTLIQLAEAIEDIYGKDEKGTRLIIVNDIIIGKKKISYHVLRNKRFKFNAQDLVTKLSKKLKIPKKYIFLKEFKNGTYMLSFDNKIRQILANHN